MYKYNFCIHTYLEISELLTSETSSTCEAVLRLPRAGWALVLGQDDDLHREGGEGAARGTLQVEDDPGGDLTAEFEHLRIGLGAVRHPWSSRRAVSSVGEQPLDALLG